MSEHRNGSAIPTPLACLECRKKHLKCDARQPICARCTASQSECRYVASRRGLRGTQRRTARSHGHTNAHNHPRDSSIFPTRSPTRSTENQIPPRDNPWNSPTTTNTNQTDPSTDATLSGPNVTSSMFGSTNQAISQHSLPAEPHFPTPSATDSETDYTNEHLIDHFYTDFYPGHPILAPQSAHAWRHYPQCLKLVMQLIGSHYCCSTPSDSWYNSTEACFSGSLAQTHNEVQAYLLYCIILQSHNESNEARNVLSKAVNLAISLGMNLSAYAVTYGSGDGILVETLRRTWWELVVIDALIAAFLRCDQLIKAKEVDSDMPLPTESFSSQDFQIECSRVVDLTAFKNRMFSGDDVCYPSSAYRIEAALALRRVLEISTAMEADADTIQSVDNCLAGWAYHLPPDKAQVTNTHGVVDHALFQGHVIIHCAIILLHFPRSNLLSKCPVSAGGLACAQKSSNKVPTSSPQVHATKALTASKSLSDLAALRSASQKVSPTFICGLTLAALVQLAAGHNEEQGYLEQYRNRLSLILGTLKCFGRNFAVAVRSEQQIRPLAANLCIKSNSTSTVPTTSGDNNLLDLSNFFFDDIWLSMTGSAS